MSIYEVHLGSWRLNPLEGNRSLTYRELADELSAYALDMGFTHIELLPVMAHPFTGSWGYQVTRLLRARRRASARPTTSARSSTACTATGLGVILDWVPAHFPRDDFALARFDGTALYEHADPRRGAHPDWGTLVFNYGRNEVRNFLVANALFWLREYHADGIRVDAVASMLYLDYSREEGQWVPNEYGGNEDLDAVGFLKELNEVVYGREPGTISAAEESTAWPGVSRPTYLGGLGFGFKWNMGWMHDTLAYFQQDPVYRRWHHHELTFSLVYAFTENFILPLSHDEVVHGKGSLLNKMPGDKWQKLANLRALYAYMWAHPGKKLLFMGQEFAQEAEWSARALARLAPARGPAARRRPVAGARPQPRLQGRAGAVGDRLRRHGVLVDRGQRRRQQRVRVRAPHDGLRGRRRVRRATCRRCRATATGSGCRARAAGASSSTPTRASTAGPTWATSAASRPGRSPGRASRSRPRSTCRRLVPSGSCRTPTDEHRWPSPPSRRRRARAAPRRGRRGVTLRARKTLNENVLAPVIARWRTCAHLPVASRRCSDSSPVIAGRSVPEMRARLRPRVRAAIVVRGVTRTGATALVTGVCVLRDDAVAREAPHVVDAEQVAAVGARVRGAHRREAGAEREPLLLAARASSGSRRRRSRGRRASPRGPTGTVVRVLKSVSAVARRPVRNV